MRLTPFKWLARISTVILRELICILRIIIFFIVIFFANVLCAVTVYGFGEKARSYKYIKGITIRNIVDDIFQKELNLAYAIERKIYFNNEIKVFRKGTVFIVDGNARKEASFPLQEGDICYFRRELSYFNKLNDKHSDESHSILSIYPLYRFTLERKLHHAEKFNINTSTDDFKDHYLVYKELLRNYPIKYCTEPFMPILKDKGNSFHNKNGVLLGNLYWEMLTPYCARVLNLKTREIKCIPSIENSIARSRFRNTNDLSQYLKESKNSKSYINANNIDIEALDFLAKKLYLNEKEKIISIKLESNGEIKVSVCLSKYTKMYVIKPNKGEKIFLYE